LRESENCFSRFSNFFFRFFQEFYLRESENRFLGSRISFLDSSKNFI
jgi:hypothetical protein